MRLNEYKDIIVGIKDIIVGILVLPVILIMFIPIVYGLSAAFLADHPLSEELDLLARQEAQKLRKRFDISPNDCIEPYLDELDIYNNMKPKEVELLKAYIKHYYYNLK